MIWVWKGLFWGFDELIKGSGGMVFTCDFGGLGWDRLSLRSGVLNYGVQGAVLGHRGLSLGV